MPDEQEEEEERLTHVGYVIKPTFFTPATKKKVAQTVGAKDMNIKPENQHQTGQQAFQTTVDSENRRRDRQRILHETGLREEASKTIQIAARTNNKPLATGYQRIVYGDHGPYLRLLELR